MKHLKLFFALFAMLALGVGNVWGQTVTWEKATSIAAGDVVALVCESKKMELSGISTTSTKYGTGVAYTSAPNGKYELTVEAGSSTGTFSFKNGSNYLYWSSGNSLNKTTTKNANASWTVTFSNGNAVIKNANTPARQIYWNASSPRFACYDKTGQTAVQLYKKVISEESEDVIVKTLKSIEVTPKTINYETGDVFKFDGTCTATYSVTKNGEPQADETAVVNPTTVSTPDMSTADTKEITVTYTEDGVTVTDTYEIEVTQNEVTPGAYTGNLNNVFFGCAVGNNATEQSSKFDDVLVVAGCKSSATSKTNYQSDHVRFYADSYLTLSVPTGYVIKSIVFTADGDWKGSITASTGTYTDGTKTWTGNAQEVKFSFAAQNRIKSVKVTYAADVKYAVNITTLSNGTLVVKEGSTVLTDGAQVYEGTKLVVTPTPNAGYVFESLTVGGEAVELTDGTYIFNMPAADVTISATFKENEKPDATLTLSKNGVEETFPGSWKQDDVVTLPSITSDCVKEFVGWSADDNCKTEPEYKAGDEYTLASPTLTQKLYAVYATVGGGGEATATNSLSSNGWANESKHTSLQIDENVKADITGGGNSGKYYTSGTNWRLYQSENATITISTTVGELKSVKFTFTSSSDGTLLYGSTKLTSGTAIEVSGTSAVFSVSDTHATENKGQIRFTAIEVVCTGGVSYSNYSTTCVAALDEPVFSVEGGENEAKTITLTATKGTIYYTLDGSAPTALSEKYTTPIVLDECGTTTVKAIAISSDSKSPVASATYTINLPITNTAATAYTPTEAIAIIDGECDKTEEVFVKGVVVSTSAFNATYGNYDVIVKAVDDNSATPTTFTFYHMYKAVGKIKFTSSDEVIGVGDIITAKGKLTKYNSTYELADGCYMIDRVAYTELKTDISNTEATAYTIDEAFELISDIKSDLNKEVYVKGFVAVASTQLYNEKYLTYSISDNGQTTGNVLKVYDGLDIGGEAFASKDDVKVGDYVVVKGKLLNYGGTYEINKDNQLVQHVKAATIKIADITMEVGETKTIAATVVPAEAEVTYTIKENTDNAISLSGKTITALAEGTATITATVAEGATYLGNSVDFTVTVGPKSEKTNVVILAQYNGEWYAMTNACTDNKQMGALKVNYVNGVILDFAGDKASITWERAIVGNKATFKNDGKYLVGGTSTTLNYTSNTFEWNVVDGKYLSDANTRTFLFQGSYFKNYAISNAGKTSNGTTYSAMPIVIEPEFATTSVLRADLYDGKWGTLCPDHKVTNMQGASFYTLTYLEMKDGMPYKLFFDEITTDYLEAGKPYLFIAEGEKIKGVKSGEVVDIASNYNGFYGNVSGGTISLTTTQTEYVADGDVVNYYGVINSRFTLLGNGTTVAHERAYVQIKNGQLDCPNPPASLPALAPGARRVVAGATGINTATGVDQVQGDEVPTKMIINGQLFILRGEKMYDAQGKLVR